MERGDDLWRWARSQAEGHLRRHNDAWTRTHRDDLVQEASIAAWRWSQRQHDGKRFWAAIRTITRRVRARGLWRAARERRACQGRSLSLAGASGERVYEVLGRRVPEHRLRPWFDSALKKLPDLDQQLLLAFHEGFCCAELAVRFRRSVPCVKTRIHRARRRVQQCVEEFASVANALGNDQPRTIDRGESR
ncbi:MAG: hypothetical protein JNL12_13610 [Planctomycetes bacterium]|nr:hypothetical protein [Planctomycetota bacterium]